MTAIVGIICKDGVVIGADSSATFVHGQQFRTIEQPCEKICVIANNVIIAGSGQIGMGQRFCHVVEKAWKKGIFGKHPLDIGRDLSRLGIDDFGYTQAPVGQYGALVAFFSGGKPCLFEFQIQDFQPEYKTDSLWYCSMGSGQPITDPFLAFMREIFWQDGPPNLQEGIFATIWTLEHAIKINPGGINGPVQIAVLESLKGAPFTARKLKDNELDEHRENIHQAQLCLRGFRESYKPTTPSEIPDTPKPK